LVIKGEITGRDDLFIDGEVQGKIRLEQGKVTIGPNGRVTADVEAQEIVIRGRVKGTLTGRDRVEIGKTGHATGDVITQRIFVEDGAEIHGSVEIKRAEPVQEKKKPAIVTASPAVAATPAATPSATTASTTPAVNGKPANGAPVTAPARESAPVV
jgi:cytoskeletal protein CcmA (bactofilin family)